MRSVDFRAHLIVIGKRKGLGESTRRLDAPRRGDGKGTTSLVGSAPVGVCSSKASVDRTRPMRPAPPPGWINKMEEVEVAQKQEKAQKVQGPQWETGICSCFQDRTSCMLGAVAPCVLFGKHVLECLPRMPMPPHRS